MKTKKELEELGFVFTQTSGGAYSVMNLNRDYKDHALKIETLRRRISKNFKFNIQEPSILTAKVYWWKPGSNANSRRHNETRRRSEVERFLQDLDFKTTSIINGIMGEMYHSMFGKISVHFEYFESCKSVYRYLSITVNGKTSNIKLLRKLYL